MGRQPKPVPQYRKNNPFRTTKPVRAPTPILVNRAVPSKPAKRACPNKECDNPKVEDGICHNCGTVVTESNIVAEVQFGEGASGNAFVQGSFVGADSGAAKSLGPAFRRAGGDGDRESTIREGKFSSSKF